MEAAVDLVATLGCENIVVPPEDFDAIEEAIDLLPEELIVSDDAVDLLLCVTTVALSETAADDDCKPTGSEEIVDLEWPTATVSGYGLVVTRRFSRPEIVEAAVVPADLESKCFARLYDGNTGGGINVSS